MNKWIFFFLVTGVLSVNFADPILTVYEADGETLFDGRDIMAGTSLTIVVTIDSNDYWSGGLFIADDNRFLGCLSGRDSDPNSRDLEDSYYSNAGDHASVLGWNDSDIWGYDLYGSDVNSLAGDWFVIDYEAIGAGEPNVLFYDYDVDWNEPVSSESFSQIKSLDYNDDEIVNILDFSCLCENWLANNCDDPNWCDGTDINEDGIVDSNDLVIFSNFWLWQPDWVPERMVQSDTTSTATETPSSQESDTSTTEEKVEILEEIWTENAAIEDCISQEEWEAFLESVKSTASN